jgi:putative flippase GtrA
MKLFFKKFHIDDTHHTGIQLYRYTFVGGVAFIVDFGLLFVFTHFFNIYYLLSATLSFLVGSVINYELSTRWIFKERTFINKNVERILFVIIGCSGLLLNAGIIFVFTEVFGFVYLVSKMISATLVYVWNFAIRKFTLFNKKITQEKL